MSAVVSSIREPLIKCDRTYHLITEDIARSVEGRANKWWWLAITSFPFFFAFIVSFLNSQGQSNGNQLYVPKVIVKEELAKIPVVRLKSTLEKGDYHLIPERFSNKVACDKFLNRFQMLEQNKIVPGCFKRPTLEFAAE